MRIHPVLALLCVTPLHPQVTTPPAPSAPAFETVSIRPSHLTPGCYSMLPPGGSQYALTCVTLRYLTVRQPMGICLGASITAVDRTSCSPSTGLKIDRTAFLNQRG